MSHVMPRPKFVGEGSTARTGAFTVLSLSLKLRGVQAPLRSRSQISPHTQQSGVSSAVVGHHDGRPVPEQRPRSEPSPSPVPRRPEGARRPRGPPRPGLAGEPAPPPTSLGLLECARADTRRGLGGHGRADWEPGYVAVPGARHVACKQGSRHTDKTADVKIEA